MKITWDFLGLGRCFCLKKTSTKPKKHTYEDNEKRSSRIPHVQHSYLRSVWFPVEVHHSTVWGVDSVAKWRRNFSSQREKKTWLDTRERELVPPVKLTRLAGNPPFPSRKLHLTFMVDFSFAMLFLPELWWFLWHWSGQELRGGSA